MQNNYLENMANETKIIHSKTFEIVKSAVNKMVDFIRPTYGPAGNKVIIAKSNYFSPLVVDDGVQAARDFELDDQAENAVVKVVREVAVRTNDRVGDGTTGALIMVQAIINEIAKYNQINGREIERELKKGFAEVKEQLTFSAKQIRTKEELKKVAMVSFDNEKMAEMLADTYFKLGKDGIITIDKSPTMETTCETSAGVKIDRGYISPYMIINPERMESVLEKPYILITDYRITEAADLLPIMNKMAAANKRELVIIAENLEQSALATAVANRVQGKFLIVAIVAPAGDDRTVVLEDIAKMTGAKMFAQSKGDKLEEAEITDLGRAERFICKQEESVIVKPKGSKKEIKDAINMLRVAVEVETNERNKNNLKKRLGAYTNSIAVIKVGAPTENEQKALKYKVEDAVNAVKAAYKGGVVAGAGLSLARLQTSSPLLNKALKYPAKQLFENMGMTDFTLPKNGTALNVVTGKTGNPMSVGVIDPVDVLIAGVESAVSIASILVTSSGMIVEIPKPENK